MAIEQVTAWKTSDGQCYLDKARAFHEETVALLKELPSVGRKGFTWTAFVDATAVVNGIIVKLQLLRAQLEPEADRRIAAGLNKLIDSASAWLRNAESLRVQVTGETDSETSTKVKNQE